MSKMTSSLLVLLASLLAAGCRHSMDDLDAYMADVSSRPPGPIEPLPYVRFPVPAERPMVHRDPFHAP